MICHVTPTIMDGIVVRWNKDEHDHREISASRNGVSIEGWLVTETCHRELLTTLAIAWDCYRMLAKDSERFGGLLGSLDVKAWLVERGASVVDVQFGETLAEAVRRERAAIDSALTQKAKEG